MASARQPGALHLHLDAGGSLRIFCILHLSARQGIHIGIVIRSQLTAPNASSPRDSPMATDGTTKPATASFDTSSDQGVFSSKSAAQALMDGEHRIVLVRRQQRMQARQDAGGGGAAVAGTSSPLVRAPSPAPTATPTPKPAAPKSKLSGKRPASLLQLVESSSKAIAVPVAPITKEKAVDDEIEKFKGITTGVLAEGPNSRFYENGLFNQKKFWYEHRTDLPLHYASFVGEVGSTKAASSNVETIFSGVGGMVQKSTSIGADLVVDYTICHHNWQYPWLEPTDDEVDKAYQRLYGDKAHESDVDSDGSGSGESDANESSDDQGEEHGE